MLIQEFPVVQNIVIPLNSKDYCNTIEYSYIDDIVLRSDKIEIYPTKKQKIILRKWFDIYRWCYNKTILHIRKYPNNINFYNLRKQIKSKFTNKQIQIIKNSKIPSHTIDNAINDVVKAYKSAFSNKNNGNIKKFKLRTKKYKHPKQTITLEASAFSKKYNTFSLRTLGKNIKSSKPIKGINKDSRLTWDKKSGKLILFAPIKKNKKDVEGREKICSLDPGIRTFQTLYSINKVSEFGKNINKEIGNLLKSIENKKKNENIPWYKKYSKRLYDKIKHKIDDLHWKTASYLVRNYDTILLGSMSTKRIISKKGNLRKNIRSVAQYISHYLFRQRLLAKAEEYNSKIIVVNEAWTSKTCGNCFKKNHGLKTAKIFKCPYCNFIWGRDYNGARNIMLRYYNYL